MLKIHHSAFGGTLAKGTAIPSPTVYQLSHCGSFSCEYGKIFELPTIFHNSYSKKSETFVLELTL